MCGVNKLTAYLCIVGTILFIRKRPCIHSLVLNLGAGQLRMRGKYVRLSYPWILI